MVRLQAIFWDNDGVLVDTEHLYFEASRRVLADIGIELPLAVFAELSLRQGRSVLDLPECEGLNRNCRETLQRRRNEIYNQLLGEGPLLTPGVETVLRSLHGKVPMAVVTSCRQEHFRTTHARTQVLHYFDFVLTRETYRHSKPHPEPYLTALQRMGATADACLAIEDTPRGLTAALQAGLRCLVLPNRLLGRNEYPGAHRILEDITEVVEVCQELSKN